MAFVELMKRTEAREIDRLTRHRREAQLARAYERTAALDVAADRLLDELEAAERSGAAAETARRRFERLNVTTAYEIGLGRRPLPDPDDQVEHTEPFDGLG